MISPDLCSCFAVFEHRQTQIAWFLQMLVTNFCHKWRKNAQLNTCNTDISIKTPKIAPIKLHLRLATDNGWGKQYLNQKPEDLQNHFHMLQFLQYL